MRLFKVYADERVDNPHIRALYGVLLCKANHPEEAMRLLSEALTLDRNCWNAHYGLTLLSVFTGDQDKRAEHTTRLQELLEPEEFGRVMQELKGIEARLR